MKSRYNITLDPGVVQKAKATLTGPPKMSFSTLIESLLVIHIEDKRKKK